MPAMIRKGPEDAGDEVEDCGGSSARKLGRPGRQEGASAAGEEEPLGLFRARGWKASSPSGRAVKELQRVSACVTVSVLEKSAANLGVLEMSLVIHEGPEDAGNGNEDLGDADDGVEDLGDAGLMHGLRASSTGCCLSSPASRVEGSTIWGWRSWTGLESICCMLGS